MSIIKKQDRDALISELLSNGKGLKNFYRFSIQNPHFDLYEASQIVIERPNASICYSFDEWNAMGRRVTKGRKGVAYYDVDGYKNFVFDLNDTHGETYKRDVLPMKVLLKGLEIISGEDLSDLSSDYQKIEKGVLEFYKNNDMLTDDKEKNRHIVEGVAYSLYCKTGFPKSNNIVLSGMTFSLKENAELFKSIYKETKLLEQEIEEAYLIAKEEVPIINDIEEETITDEPIVTNTEVKQVEEQKSTHPLHPIYKRYIEEQNKNPNAVIVQRLGDFYEVMGDKAKAISEKLDLILTGRDFGLEERMPMIGFPYHVADKYIDIILEDSPVVVLEQNKEPKFIESKKKERPKLIALSEEESLEFDELFNSQLQQENDNEENSETEDYLDEIEIDYDYDEELEDLETEEDIEEQPQEEIKPKQPRTKKKKEKPQLSFFDVIDNTDEEEQSAEEQLIERELKKGSRFQDGKFTIANFYNTDPTDKEFADFLKHHYGIGGYSGGAYSGWYDAKGMRLALRDDETRENIVEVSLNWTQVARRISELIDEDNYFYEEEKIKFKKYQAQRHGTDNDRIKAIVDWMVEYATKYTWDGEYYDWNFGDVSLFARDHIDKLKDELESRKEVESVWVTESFNSKNLGAKFYDEYCSRVEKKKETIVTKEENTDLTEVGFDQSELGGAKTRFHSNVQAIKLLNKLHQENRQATSEERKTLARYVGWGGLQQAFDENNDSWKKEYLELKDLLNEEDYAVAKSSVLNAHFTPKEVIDGIYQALQQFGVKENNKILEPAMGTGNFFGFMPSEISKTAKLYGVELDNITGQIAKKLYPNANIQIKGFEKTTFSDNQFDVIIGNVPFGAYSVHDSDYNKYNFYIHDYFLAKSIDKLRPNGIMAVITSSGTMDKQNPKLRKYLADRAELLGAIRLPNTAFKQTAGTEVVADVLFFKKREEKIDANLETTEWIGTSKNSQGFVLNNYFISHPYMVLGELVEERGLYGAISLTVKAGERKLTDSINDAVLYLPKDVYLSPEKTDYLEDKESIEVDYDVKPLCYKAVNGKLYMRIGESMVEQTVPSHPKDAYLRISGMISIRQQLRKILNVQLDGCSDETLENEQWILNSLYDTFVKRFGILNSQTNIKLFKEDADSALLFACENLTDDKKKATKADIFSKRTIRPYVAVTSTDDCFEALQISKNEHGKVDIAYIEELTKKDYDTVINELGTAVFRNPVRVNPEDKYSGFETAEEYLSGKVVQKLEIAKEYVKDYPEMGYEKNIVALGQVQPEKIKASDISVRIGTSWIDPEYYRLFLYHLLGIPAYYRDGVSIYYNKHDSSWRVDKSSYLNNFSYMNVHEVYGTKRASAYRLFEDCLNLRSTAIYDMVEENGREKRVLNQVETIAVREKQNEIKEKFREWIFATPERRDALETTYNSKFNQIRLPTYDGSYLKFPEMNPAIELRPHQKNAVHRIITSGNTLLHHVVGSGKTYTICATIMKLRQYGLAKKPLIAVPNHLTEQWANSFRTLYPNANLLVAQREDLDKEHRERFVSKVALGDWDAVIMAQSSFAKIPISKERQIRKIQEEIERIEETIEFQRFNSNHPTGSVKNLERIKKNREAQLNKLLDESKKDGVLIFENLGVDYLFIDEAHYYKNKFLFTKMNNVSGISNAASQRASDLELKVEYINELHGGDKGVVFATGTPISNSMTEMYTMQSYLQKRSLEDVGISFFDNWASSFGETIQSLELAPSGQGYKAKTRFAKFVNLPELLTMYRSFADVQTADMVKLDVPTADRRIVNLKPSDAVLALAEEIAERAERIHDGAVDPHEDNMLKVTSDGKKLALDPRCMDRLAPDEEGSKINACAQNVFEEWVESKNIKGTQLVFCDLSTPKKSFSEYEYGKDFDVYNDLKYKLVQKGIPEDEIAFIHDANNDKQKQALFDKVNSGAVRVLVGSTEKCGAGTNVQERLVALHHLDTPYRPSDMEQRNGRGIRQGNINENIRIYTYVKERTFDSYSYQILENKQRFISQIDRGDLTIREADDIDETTLSYAEIKAITSANPKIKRKMEVDTEIQRLRVLESQYRKSLYSLQDKIHKQYPEEIQRQTLYLERLKSDIQTVKERFNPEEFKINVLGTEYTDKKLGGQALLNALHSYKSETIVAEYAGFKISLNPLVMLDIERSISLTCNGRYSMNIGDSASGLLLRLENFFNDFSSRQVRAETKLEQLKQDLEIAKEQEKKPFEHAQNLAELLKEQAELNAELDLSKREEVIIQEDEDNDENIGKVIMSETKDVYPQRKEPRKALTKAQEEMYEKQVKTSPESYVFINNGSYFDILGEKAEELAKKYGKEIITENEKKVLSLNTDEVDTIIREVVDSGNQVKIIESIAVEKEVDFIQEEDKVAKMEVPIMPSYAVDQDYMHSNGYLWDGMLPVTKKTARTLYAIGLNIFKLYDDNTESEVASESGIDVHQGLFGIEKPTWLSFIETKEGINYLCARHAMTNSASKVVNETLSYIDNGFTIDFNNSNFIESKQLAKYLSGKDVNVKEMAKTIPMLLNEFTDRIYRDELEYYGWVKNDVSNALADELQPDELLEEANKEVDRQELMSYLYDGLYEYHVVDLMKGKSIGELDDSDAADNVLTELKEHFENTRWAEGFEDEAYDEWYDEFSEYTLKPILMGKHYKSGEEILESEMDKMTDEELLDFLDINIKYKEIVIKRVEKEHREFLQEMEKKTSSDVIANNYQIYVKNELAEMLMDGETLDDEYYRALYYQEHNLLDELYYDFLSLDYVSVNNYGESKWFVENYCERYLSEYVLTDDEVQELNSVQELLDACKLDDITLSMKDGLIVAVDSDNKKWEGKEFYEFIFNEALQLEQDYKLVPDYAVEQSIIDEVLKHAKRYNPEINVIKPSNYFKVKNTYKDDVRLKPSFELYTVSDGMGNNQLYGIALRTDAITNIDGKEYLEPFASITKNFGEFIGLKNSAYVDTNNWPQVTQLIDLGIAKDTGFRKETDYYSYPLWTFDEQFLQEVGGEKYKQYSKVHDEYLARFNEPEEVDYKQEVLDIIKKEWLEFEQEILSLPPEEIFIKNHESYAKERFLQNIESFEKDEEYYQSLYLDKDEGILESLYSEFFALYDEVNLGNEIEVDRYIKDYCKTYHTELFSKKEGYIYFGKDDKHTAFYYFKDKLSLEYTEPRIKEPADEYIIAAPVCYLSQEYLEEHNITFLKIERDIDETELKFGNETAIFAMRASFNKKMPLEATMVSCDCMHDIEKDIETNFDGSHLNTENIPKLIALYGQERMDYVFANTVQMFDTDGRFSLDNKEWAKEIKINNSDEDRRNFIITSHRAVLDGYITSYRKKIKEFNENLDKEKEMPENESTKRKWVSINVSQDALIRRLDKVSVFRMPNTSEYAGDTYLVFNDKIKSSTQLVDLQSDSRELSYRLAMPEDGVVSLRDKDGKDYQLTVSEFSAIVNETQNKDYYQEPDEGSTSWFSAVVPQEALIKMKENSSLFMFPNTSSLSGYSFGLPNTFISEDKNGEDGSMRLSMPSNLEIVAYKYGSDERVNVTPHQVFVEMHKTTAEDYKRMKVKTEYEESKKQEEKTNKSNSDWNYVSVSANAKIAEYDEYTLFKMPKDSEFKDYCYSIPNSLLRENDKKGTFAISIPDGFVIRCTNNKAEKDEEKRVDLKAEDFIEMVKSKGADAYEQYKKPSEERESNTNFEYEESLVEAVPNEMKAKPNWVAVKTWYNEKKDRTEKRPIDCNTGEYADVVNPKTWTTFDKAREYVRENGLTTLAYALDGKDSICCVDIDNCFDENGEYTPLANELLSKCGKAYTESSISGKGLHIFGKTKGMDVRSFSKDGDMEFYQSGRFISMTGSGVGFYYLDDFDSLEIKDVIKRKCEKRTEWKGQGLGVEGLSLMTDREVVEKACADNKHGKTFKALYEGQDLQNNHSNSDMSLMNRLAFWCNGDKEQMLRIFATSGLYRPDKSSGYYEGTAIKAVKDTTSRYRVLPQQPKTNNGFGKDGK